MAEPLLCLERLTKSYGALKVTDGVTLDVAPGEIHAVIGPNGAGKTSLVGQISGFLHPDSGRILFRGEDITRLSAYARAQRGLARTFQITSLLPDFSALDNVALAAQARHGTSFRFFRPAHAEERLNARALEALAAVGLAKRPDIRAGLLSHGEQRALELAIALAQEPKLLLLDEPLAGTGREEGDRILAMLHALRSHCAMLLVEHDMEAVFMLADRISVLVYGRLIATGTPAEIRADGQVREAYLGAEAA